MASFEEPEELEEEQEFDECMNWETEYDYVQEDENDDEKPPGSDEILQQILDEASVSTENHPFQVFRQYNWENYTCPDNLEIKALFEIMRYNMCNSWHRENNLEHFKEWLTFPNEMSLIHIVTKLHNTDLYDFLNENIDLLANKNPQNMTKDCFSYLMHQLKLLNEDIPKLFKLYEPFSHDGEFHKYLFDKNKFELYLQLSEMYSFTGDNFEYTSYDGRFFDTIENAVDLLMNDRYTDMKKNLNDIICTLDRSELSVMEHMEFISLLKRVLKYHKNEVLDGRVITKNDTLFELKDEINSVIERENFYQIISFQDEIMLDHLFAHYHDTDLLKCVLLQVGSSRLIEKYFGHCDWQVLMDEIARKMIEKNLKN